MVSAAGNLSRSRESHPLRRAHLQRLELTNPAHFQLLGGKSLTDALGFSPSLQAVVMRLLRRPPKARA
jgi:hypothetical protein